MPSNIISETIDEQYPVAGADNDSQGFRDNFNIIKQNAANAKIEIDDLQEKAVLKAPLTGESSVNNNFDNNTISVVNFLQSTMETNTAIVPDNDRPVSFQGGHYYVVDTVSTNIVLTFQDWPLVDQYAEITVQLTGNGSAAHTVTFASEYASGATSNLYTDSFGSWAGSSVDLNMSTSTATIIKAWTTNQGQDVYLRYLGEYSQV
jgi:hypothetical protein